MIKQYPCRAEKDGTITVSFLSYLDCANVALINAIEVLPALSQDIDNTVVSYRINAGGSDVHPFKADAYYSGGATAQTQNQLDLSDVTNAAPYKVYQSDRYAVFNHSHINMYDIGAGLINRSKQKYKIPNSHFYFLIVKFYQFLHVIHLQLHNDLIVQVDLFHHFHMNKHVQFHLETKQNHNHLLI